MRAGSTRRDAVLIFEVLGQELWKKAVKHMNYATEDIDFLGCTGINEDRIERIRNLCALNVHVKSFFHRTNQSVPTIPLALWPRVLEAVECKPDLRFGLLKAKPEVCRDPQHKKRSP